MPEILPVYQQLFAIVGSSDRAALFLSTWFPPRYLGGCSLAAMADETDVRLLRNHDLTPDINKGLLLRTEWASRAVMGMGFGATMILRYLLEVCDTVEEALVVLPRVPSHMACNIVLADAPGATACLELLPGGGARRMLKAIAANHQSGPELPDREPFTRTCEHHQHLTDNNRGERDLHLTF